MKIRYGFVSNSSSCSFIVKNMSEQQYEKCIEFNDRHTELYRWDITMHGPVVEFSTCMDNLGIDEWCELLASIGIGYWDISSDDFIPKNVPAYRNPALPSREYMRNH